jgi:hypothetical protein
MSKTSVYASATAQCDSTLARERRQRLPGSVDREQDANRPAAQGEGRQDAAREFALDPRAQGRQRIAWQLGPDGQRHVQRGGELLRAGQLCPLEIDQVQGGRRDAGQPPGLRDDLVAQQLRRHLVEHVADLGRRKCPRRTRWTDVGVAPAGRRMHAGRFDETATTRRPRARPSSNAGATSSAGLHWGADLFGWLGADGLATLLTALLAVTGAAVRLTQTDTADATDNATTIGIVGGVALPVILLVNGPRQGIGVWLIGLILTIALAAAGALLGAE